MCCMLWQRLLHHNFQQCVCAHVCRYPTWWICAYLAAKQPRHEVRVNASVIWFTNTKSLAKEFSKILIFEYFVHSKTGFDVFLTLIQIHPA